MNKARKRGWARTDRRHQPPPPLPDKKGREPIFDELDRRIAEEDEQNRMKHGGAEAATAPESEDA